jgi:hypothetical protein
MVVNQLLMENGNESTADGNIQRIMEQDKLYFYTSLFLLCNQEQVGVRCQGSHIF